MDGINKITKEYVEAVNDIYRELGIPEIIIIDRVAYPNAFYKYLGVGYLLTDES